MSKAKTKDEKFLVCLYEEASKTDDLYSSFNKYEIGQKVSIHARGVDTICALLLRANFIKKDGEKEIRLTEHGERLVKQLLED